MGLALTPARVRLNSEDDLAEANSFDKFLKNSKGRAAKLGSLERAYAGREQQVRLAQSVPGEIAVKVYLREKMKSSVRRKIVQNEFEVLRRLDHPRVIKFFQKVETPRQIHLLMEYFRGQGLESFLKRFLQRRVPQKIGRPILRQILEGLEYLHGQSIFHRGGTDQTSSSKT